MKKALSVVLLLWLGLAGAAMLGCEAEGRVDTDDDIELDDADAEIEVEGDLD